MKPEKLRWVWLLWARCRKLRVMLCVVETLNYGGMTSGFGDDEGDNQQRLRVRTRGGDLLVHQLNLSAARGDGSWWDWYHLGKS